MITKVAILFTIVLTTFVTSWYHCNHHDRTLPLYMVDSKGDSKLHIYTSTDVNIPKKDSNLYFDRVKHTLHDFGVYSKNQYDYDDIEYPIPFNDWWGDLKNRYENFDSKSDIFGDYVKTGPIQSNYGLHDKLFITGASSNHFELSINAVLGVFNVCSIVSLAYIDLGLDSSDISQLSTVFDYIHRIQQKAGGKASIYYRRLNYATAPTWMNISVARGEYAWKAIAIMDFAWYGKLDIGWIDAGQMMVTCATQEDAYLLEEGAYSPASEGRMRKWVHPLSLDFLNTMNMTDKVDDRYRMLSGNHIFLNSGNETVINEIFIPWYQCCVTRKCIAPYGTSRKNHRQDQAMLSMFMHNIHLKYSGNLDFNASAKHHQDRMGINNIRIVKKSLIQSISKKSGVKF